MPIPAKTQVAKRLSAKMRVYYTIRDWIIYGTLKPGERLIDQELSDYFEVSRTPVREAIQLLQSQKLVDIIPNKATVVSAIDMQNPEKWYLPLAHVHALAAEMACKNITDTQMESLKQIEKRIVGYASQRDIIDTLHEDARFHNTILAIAQNEFICEFSETLMTHIQRFEYHFFNQPDFTIESFASHQMLLEKLEKRDGEGAHEEMLNNWLSTLKRYNQLLSSKTLHLEDVAPVSSAM